MGLDDDLDDEVGDVPPDYGDGPKDADAGGPAGPADLSDSSGDPADDPDTEALADAEAREEVPGDLAVDPRGTFHDHDGDDLPDAAFYDDAGEPVPDVPAPITPNTPTDQAQRRVSYERLINDQANAFADEARQTFISHALEGRTVRIQGINADGSDFDPEDGTSDNPGYPESRGGIDTVNDSSRGASNVPVNVVDRNDPSGEPGALLADDATDPEVMLADEDDDRS